MAHVIPCFGKIMHPRRVKSITTRQHSSLITNSREVRSRPRVPRGFAGFVFNAADAGDVAGFEPGCRLHAPNWRTAETSRFRCNLIPASGWYRTDKHRPGLSHGPGFLNPRRRPQRIAERLSSWVGPLGVGKAGWPAQLAWLVVTYDEKKTFWKVF